MQIQTMIDFGAYREKETLNEIKAAAFALALVAATQEIQACLFGACNVDDFGNMFVNDGKLMRHIYESFSGRDILEMMNCFKANGKQLLIFYDQLKKLMKEGGKLTAEILEEPCSLKELTTKYRFGSDTFYNEILRDIITRLELSEET